MPKTLDWMVPKTLDWMVPKTLDWMGPIYHATVGEDNHLSPSKMLTVFMSYVRPSSVTSSLGFSLTGLPIGAGPSELHSRARGLLW